MADPIGSIDVARFLADLIGAIGGVLGIASWWRVNQREKEEDDMWALLAEFAKSQERRKEGKNIFNPPKGTKEWKLAERLVERGLLTRSPLGGYQLPESSAGFSPYA